MKIKNNDPYELFKFLVLLMRKMGDDNKKIEQQLEFSDKNYSFNCIETSDNDDT